MLAASISLLASISPFSTSMVTSVFCTVLSVSGSAIGDALPTVTVTVAGADTLPSSSETVYGSDAGPSKEATGSKVSVPAASIVHTPSGVVSVVC